MSNICTKCHRLKANNPSRLCRDCWNVLQQRERVEHYFTARPGGSEKAADARHGAEGTNIKGEAK